MKRKIFVAVILSILTLSLCGCGSEGGGDEGGGQNQIVVNDQRTQIVVNDQRTLADGSGVSFALPAGTYHLEATSSGPNGLSVSWLGGNNCNNLSEVLTYNDNCTLTIAGQLVITNSSTFGLGPSEIITVQVSK
jgi:hypothetical protein